MKAVDANWNTAVVEVIPVESAEADMMKAEVSGKNESGGSSRNQNIFINNLTMSQGQALMTFWNNVQTNLPDEVSGLTPKFSPWKDMSNPSIKTEGKLSAIFNKKKPRGEQSQRRRFIQLYGSGHGDYGCTGAFCAT